MLEEDRAALESLFTAATVSSSGVPTCDVLLIYARVETDGRIGGTIDSLRDIIRKANALIAIMASENEPNSLIAAGKPTGYGRANLVLTLKRKGAAFPMFFSDLFGMMRRGVTMPLAWVKLAPQNPRARHENCPETIFSAEVSHILFN